MKYILSFIFTITFLVGHSQYSDLKEYGYRGNVQKVITKTYMLFDSKTGKPTDSLNLFSTVIFSVDENGNFHEVKTIPAADSTIFSLNKYSFINQRKSFMKTYDSKGNEQKKDTASFQWINDKSYILTYHYNNRIYEIATMLKDDFRDFMGITYVYELNNNKKKLIKSEKSENFFDSDGHIQKIIVTDMEKMTQSFRYVKDKVLDNHGNLIQYKVVDESGNVLQYVERKFFY